ncbi:unnamed protein product, partial [Ectocarpus sp. 12 AP-2014]
MQTNFSVEESISNLWDKLDGWLESIILKLPNFAMAVLVMFLFYFLARGIRKLLKKTILRKISQVSIQEIIAKVVFVVIILIG